MSRNFQYQKSAKQTLGHHYTVIWTNVNTCYRHCIYTDGFKHFFLMQLGHLHVHFCLSLHVTGDGVKKGVNCIRIMHFLILNYAS